MGRIKSFHSINICTSEQYNKWEGGRLLYNEYDKQFSEEVPLTDKDCEDAGRQYEKQKQKYYKDWDELSNEEQTEYTEKCMNVKRQNTKFKTWNEWHSKHYSLDEIFYTECFTTPAGEKMVAFGYYGCKC